MIATKAGFSAARGGRVVRRLPRRAAPALDLSLRRLGVDHVDLWQVHVWDDDDPARRDARGARHRGDVSGRTSYVGISNYTGWQTAQAATWQRAVPGRAPLASTQMEYSLLNRAIEEEVLPACRCTRARRAPLLPPRPRASSPASTAPASPSDSRGAAAHLSSASSAYLGDRAGRVVDAVARAADGLGWTPMEVALVWVRDRPGVTAPIVGARTAAQLRGALDIEDKTLPEELVQALDDVSDDG